ncbi:D-alanine--D-alanine ligase [Verrucomicrobiaceae bacterium 5K15]|uniref:D-alanine--D-alanine ligase n=1 Tax=Oceaniferula flava TaxID=2800421 RepID=A0AAE2SA25_9BACT|nr:D-alanine--D-alanine ligase [Oceaniferula flavus]MBK1854003.1 D-alanine--D-alanine ligase [Oceaniferula flavus]MBM1135309.1 D-alanine--D-alanine ligase [Oceaniferula flavus]
MDKQLLIAVLMGGPGSERKVSLASGNAVLEALQGEGLNAVGVDVTDHALDVPEGTRLCFNVIHGTFGEDGEMQQLLEDMGMPYTGAGVESSRLAFDKVASKVAFVDHGVPTPASEIVDCSSGAKLPDMALPYVVKPPREGSSVGVHIVQTEDEAMAAMEDAAKYGDEVLVEQFVQGKELTVGVLDDEVLPIVHIAPRSGFYDMNNKYPWLNDDGGTDYYCPADLDEATTKKVQDAALAAHRALGCEIYSRVDVLLDDDGNPFVLEANTIPGMTASSLLPKAAKVAGYEFGPLCQKIAELSLAERS